MSNQLTVITTISGMAQAQILKSKLDAAGIKAILNYESAGQVLGIITTGTLGQIQILVADQDAAKARHLLTDPPPPGWEEEATASGDI